MREVELEQLEAAAHQLSPLKLKTLSAYHKATLPLRWYLAAQQAARDESRVMMLFYHRVARDCEGAWTTCPEIFRDHVQWIKEHLELATFAESQRRVRDGNTRPSVHITFDDGYADNCEFALPLLIFERVPVTYFVSSAHVLQQRPFEHDLRRNKSLAVNTPSQIRAMAEAGVEIGAHTRNHVDLSTITDEREIYDEIVGSKHDLEDMTGKPVRYFAFPFGHRDTLTPAAMRVVREAGFEGVCSAYGGYNFPKRDAFYLQRIHGDNDCVRFKNWMTLDPRKIGVHFEPQYSDSTSEFAEGTEQLDTETNLVQS